MFKRHLFPLCEKKLLFLEQHIFVKAKMLVEDDYENEI